jgi:hypothetical protein
MVFAGNLAVVDAKVFLGVAQPGKESLSSYLSFVRNFPRLLRERVGPAPRGVQDKALNLKWFRG